MIKSLFGWPAVLNQPGFFQGDGRFVVDAYSEFMPGPYVGAKPYTWEQGINHDALDHDVLDPWVIPDPNGCLFGVSEYEEHLQLRPGLLSITKQLVSAFRKLLLGKSPSSKYLLKNNPYWPESIAARADDLIDHERGLILLPLAFSKTLDDKGRVRFTLFGSSEQGPSRPFWKSFQRADESLEQGQQRCLAFLKEILSSVYEVKENQIKELADLKKLGFHVLSAGTEPNFSVSPQTGSGKKTKEEEEWPSWVQELALADTDAINDVKYLLTFRPFAFLPAAIQEAYLQKKLHLLPFPGSLVFFGHEGYHHLAQTLPGALQIPLLHAVSSRQSAPWGLRILQAGWIREPYSDPTRESLEVDHGPVLDHIQRPHRFNRVERDQEEASFLTLHEKVSRALFENSKEALGLYGKPMAKNAQLWTHDYRSLLHGPKDGRQRLEEATYSVDTGGQFGYRFFFPPMQVGNYEFFWHRPLCAFAPLREVLEEKEPTVFFSEALGYLTAYPKTESFQKNAVLFWPKIWQRPLHTEAIELFQHRLEKQKFKTTLNVRKLLQVYEQLQMPLPPSFARSLLTTASSKTLTDWFRSLPERALDKERGEQLSHALTTMISIEEKTEQRVVTPTLPPKINPLTFAKTRLRAFEEQYFQTIATLAHGQFVHKDNADPVSAVGNQKSPRDLEALGDFLHERYHELMAQHKMTGKAMVADHVFRWRTPFDFPWSEGWTKNQIGTLRERNIIFMIPGKNRKEAVIMADHYDTAYMEDVYHNEKEGPRRVAAAGADDNHSATAALLLAADVFLSLSKQGLLERDIWLVHLTGEEFPADCLGARHLVQRLVERNAAVVSQKTGYLDLSDVSICGAFILDMVAHNNDHASYVFQISPGEGKASMELAYQAHLCNESWNEQVPIWNQAKERQQKGPSTRVEQPLAPDMVAYPVMRGEVRPNWHFKSSLYNTDAQIFSDAGIPVVLFMEDYDINRTGYHDTQDTLKNIDLDYGAALAAIAIETVAQVAAKK